MRATIAHFGLVVVCFVVAAGRAWGKLPRGYSPPHPATDPRMCGVNSAWVMLRLLGYQVEHGAVSRILVAGEGGNSLEQIRRALDSFGLYTEIRKVSFGDLQKLDPPFIIHEELVDIGGTGHFSVVSEILRKAGKSEAVILRLIDGSSGKLITTSPESLKQLFTGYVLVPRRAGWKSRWLPWIAAGAVYLAGLGILLGFGLPRSGTKASGSGV